MDDYGLTLVTGPATEPVTLAEAKSWLRVDHAADDAVITALVSAARQLAERQYDRQLVSATWRLTLRRFPCGEIRLPRCPLRSVTSVQYLDADGALQTLDSSYYVADAAADPGELSPAWGYSWPVTYPHPQAVRVTYQSGYGAASDVPEPIKAALKYTVACWFQRRGDGELEVDAAKLSLPSATAAMLMAYWPGVYP